MLAMRAEAILSSVQLPLSWVSLSGSEVCESSFMSRGVSRCRRSVHQAPDECLARLLMSVPDSLIRKRWEHPRLSPIQALQGRFDQVLGLHNGAGRKAGDG